MYISHLSTYVPVGRLSNEELAMSTGKTKEWYSKRTGIYTRSRAAPAENASTMAISAIQKIVAADPSALTGVDLIIAGSYTPNDTLATIAHRVQRYFSITNANALYISTACTSFISMLELAEVYINTNKSKKALIVATEHNSAFSSDEDSMSGHLWGDGAGACIIQSAATRNVQFKLEYTHTSGLANLRGGPNTLGLDIKNNNIFMHSGREVFTLACQEMVSSFENLLRDNDIVIADIDVIVPHQANQRIITKVTEALGANSSNIMTTVERYGNTGCASIPITLLDGLEHLGNDCLLACIAFGGGYSSGAALLRTARF